MKKIITFINKEFNGVNEAALLLGSLTLLSQFLGLLRDRMLAHNVGAGPILDVYYAAFRIPDFLYVSVASLISVTVLLPFLIEKMGKDKDKEKGRRFMNDMFTAFILFMFCVSVLVYILMPYLAKLIAPGFSPSNTKSLIEISRIMLLSPIFIGLSNMFGIVTQAYKRFFIFSLSSVFYNLGIILGIIFLYPIFGLNGLAIGVVCGAMLHLAIQIPTVIKIGFLPRLSLKFNIDEILKVASISLPRTIALASSSISFIAIISIASTIGDGAISLFTFSYNIQSVPVGIIGISFSVAAFPMLVQSFSSQDKNSFVNYITNSAKQIIFWSLPVMSLFVVLRAQIVRVVLGVDTFSWSDTRLTAATLAIFVLSLATQGLVFLFVRGYYAAGNTKKPLVINVFSALIVIVLSFVFMNLFKTQPQILKSIEKILRIEDVPNTLMLALPLAYVFGSFFNLLFLWRVFKKDFLHGISSGLRTIVFQSGVSATAIGTITYIALGLFDDIFSLSTFWGIFLQGLFSGLIGIIAGILVLYLLKNQELKDIYKALHNKFWKNKIITQEQREL